MFSNKYIKIFAKETCVSLREIDNKEVALIAKALKNKTCVLQTLDIIGERFQQIHQPSPSTHTQQGTTLVKEEPRASPELFNQTHPFMN